MLYKLFLFFCFFLPFQVALNPAEGIDLASVRVFILTLFFFCLAKSLKDKKIQVPFNLQTGLIFSFLFLAVLSFFVAQNNEWSIRKLAYLFSIFPVYFVATYLAKNKIKILNISKALVFGGALVAVLGIIQFFSQFIFGLERVYKFWADYVIVPFLGKTFSLAVLQNPSWLVNISGKTYLRATSIFPDPHMLSFFLGLTSALTIGIMLASQKKFFYGIILGSLLVCNILTFSRGGYLGIFVGAAFLIILFWKKISIKSKSFIIASGLLVALIFSMPNLISQRYLSIFNFQEGSNKGRIEIWQKTLSIIENNPFLGLGIGNYPLEIKPTANYREPYYAHNTYLDIAAETGMVNTLIWMGLLFFSWFNFVKRAKRDIIFLGPALGILIFSVHSLVETAIYSPVVLTLFLIMLSFNNLKENESRNI